MTQNPTSVLAIAPFERLALPPHLDGSLVPHQYPCNVDPHLDVRNDMDAIGMWLADVAKTPATYDLYRLTAERCLLWSVVELNRPMSVLDDENAQAYLQFLLDPRPRTRWVCSGKPRRNDPAWRPFQRPMTPSTRDHAIGILSTLWDWLTYRGYVSNNPWARTLLGRNKQERRIIAPGLSTEARDNITTAIEWAYIELALQEFTAVEGGPVAARSRAIFYLTYFADIKPGEMITLRTAALREIDKGPMPVWTLSLGNRSEPRREIVLLPPVQRALQHYFESSGRTLWTGTGQFDHPLVAQTRTAQQHETKLSKDSLHKIAQPLFERAAALALNRGDTLAARRLSQSSLQWLNHAFEIHLAHRKPGGNWPWFMLGSTFLVPISTSPFLPHRMPLQVDTILQGFEQLREMWQPYTA